MLYLATEISNIVRDIGLMECRAVKTASAEESYEAQAVVATSSSLLYDQIVKEAADRVPLKGPMYMKVPVMLEKAAEALHKDSLGISTRVKLAAVVNTDEVLSGLIESESDETELHKLAELRAYGREYFVNILQKVL